MIKTNFLELLFKEQLRKDNDKKEENHKPSGKLSASRLGVPLQWQVLSALGVRTDDIDDYTLCKFKRGVDVERSIIDTINKQGIVEDEQVECSYRNVVGYLDLLVNNEGEKIGVEIKSITNANFKWIAKSGAKHGHILQSALYGLALGLEKTNVLYIASDDYRLLQFEFSPLDYKEEIDEIIDRFDKQMKKKLIPPFKATEKWQENPKYNSFYEWATMSKPLLKRMSAGLFENYKKNIAKKEVK